MRVLIVYIMISGCAGLHAQARRLEVSMNKTTSIVFPSSINSIDRGSDRIIVQKSTGNILRVKADSSFADTTNLTVITVDGKLYSFLVSYAASPRELTIELNVAVNILQDTGLLSFARKIKATENHLHGVRFGSGKVWLSLAGVYTNGDIIGCKLKIENTSPLSFEIGRITATLNGGHATKRRASHEQDVDILLTDLEMPLIREKQAGIAVVILPKAGLAPGQILQIGIQEKGSERHLKLSIPNRLLLSAYLIQ